MILEEWYDVDEEMGKLDKEREKAKEKGQLEKVGKIDDRIDSLIDTQKQIECELEGLEKEGLIMG